MIIGKNDISRGLRNKSIGFRKSPNNDGIVCQIGEHWFYFGGAKAAEYNDPHEWIKHTTRREIINDVFDALWDLQHDGETPSDEWFYYYYYLHEYDMKHNCDEIRKILEKNNISRDGEEGWLYNFCDWFVEETEIFEVCRSGGIGETHQT